LWLHKFVAAIQAHVSFGVDCSSMYLGNNFANVFDNLHVLVASNAQIVAGILVVHELISMLAHYNLM
jgi:hypothetical protein